MKQKKMMVGMLIAAAIFVAQALPFAAFAAEEKWPTRPITIFIGYAPGGGMDMMGRLLSEEMRKPLGVAMPPPGA
jgi:tripartite-type tricarboxylate transporter receptor subunit TctC